MRYRTSTYNLMTLSAFFILTSNAQAMFSVMDTDFTLESANTLQEQTYLDNYLFDYGSRPLFSVRLDNAMTLSNTYNSKSLIDFKLAYYEKIKTYVAGLGYVSRMNLPFASKAAIYGAVDYTHYNYIDFYQLALGAQGELANFNMKSNLYLPVGSGDSWGGSFDSILIGMKGMDFSLSKSFDALSFSFDYSFHWNDAVKNDISSATLGASYNFNKTLILGGKYQYRHGLDSEDSGYKGYISIPLFSSSAQTSDQALSSKPIERQFGVLIQAEEDTACADSGSDSFSKNGINYCADTDGNPWSSANIKMRSGLRGASLTSIDTEYRTQTDATYHSGLHMISRPLLVTGKLDIMPGAHLVFSPGAFILAQDKNTTIGTSTGKRVTIHNAPSLSSGLSSAPGQSRERTIQNAISTSSVMTQSITPSSEISLSNLGYAIVLYGTSNMDFDAAKDSSAFESSSTNPILAGSSVTAATVDGTLDSKLSSSTGMLNGLTIGGDTSALATDYAQLNNVSFNGTGMMLLAANTSMNKLNFHNGVGSQIYQLGGKSEISSSTFTAGAKTQNHVKVRGAGQVTTVGSLFNQSNADLTGFSGIKFTDAHKNTAANDANKEKLPQLTAADNLFVMGTSTVAKQNALSISDLNNISNGGMALVMTNNVVYMPAATDTVQASDGISFADIASDATTEFGTGGDVVMDHSLMLVGQNLVPNFTATDDDKKLSLVQYGMGFGKLTIGGTDSSAYAQGGTTFAFGLEDSGATAYGFVSNGFVNTDLEDITTANSQASNMQDAAWQNHISAQATITLETSAQTTYKSHIVSMPKSMGSRKIVETDALTSRFGSTPETLTTAVTDTTTDTKLFLNSSFETVHNGNNTVTGSQMTQNLSDSANSQSHSID